MSFSTAAEQDNTKYVFGRQDRPTAPGKTTWVIENGLKVSKYEKGAVLEPNALFIERDGSEHQLWIQHEFIDIVKILDNPEIVSHSPERPSHPELRATMEGVVAWRRTGGHEEVQDIAGGCPVGCYPAHRPGVRAYKRLDGKNPMEWNYRLVPWMLHAKTGARILLPENRWRVEYLQKAPPRNKNASPQLAILEPSEIEARPVKSAEQDQFKIAAARAV